MLRKPEYRMGRENRIIWLNAANNLTRWGATGRLVVDDLTQGIDGKNVLDNALQVPRNVAIGTWHAVQSIIPLGADTVDAALHREWRRYDLVDRDNEKLAGTRGSIQKITTAVRQKRIFGTLSAILAEATDGPVDDLAHLLTGAPKNIIRPAN